MAPKKTKLSLSSFLNDESTGKSWADEMDDMPTAPGDFDALTSFKRSTGGERPSYGARDSYGGPERDARPPRPDVPFPTQPPYTAFVGNMSFECSQEDVSDFFTNEGLKVTNVRMISGYDGKPKGFCYAEFPEADMLRAALELSGQQLAGRTIRISVAEPPRADSAGRSDGDWTRSGPLPDLPGRSGGFNRGAPAPGGRFERGPPPPMEDDRDRDWGAVRGSRFTPSEPSSPALGSGRPGFGDRREPSSARMGGGFGGSRDRDFSGSSAGGPPPMAEDRDWGAARGSRFVPTAPVPDRRPSASIERKASDADEVRDWRARASPASPAISETSTPPAAPAQPVERKKLQLSARTVSSTSSDAGSAASPATPSNKPNPFGGAAPVNTAQREEAVLEARRAKEKQEAEERKKAKEAAEAAAAANAANGADKASATTEDKAPAAAQKSWRRPADQPSSTSTTSTDDLTNKMSNAKIAESKSANPGKAWRRPSGPHSGLTDQSPNAPQSQVAKAAEEKQQQQQAPRQIAKNQGLRKEGFSYSNIAGAKSQSPKPPSQPLASDNIVPDTVPVKQKEGEGPESISA